MKTFVVKGHWHGNFGNYENQYWVTTAKNESDAIEIVKAFDSSFAELSEFSATEFADKPMFIVSQPN